jgi:hypothetical protein
LLRKIAAPMRHNGSDSNGNMYKHSSPGAVGADLTEYIDLMVFESQLLHKIVNLLL